jgi:hypothetical protein
MCPAYRTPRRTQGLYDWRSSFDRGKQLSAGESSVVELMANRREPAMDGGGGDPTL